MLSSLLGGEVSRAAICRFSCRALNIGVGQVTVNPSSATCKACSCTENLAKPEDLPESLFACIKHNDLQDALKAHQPSPAGLCSISSLIFLGDQCLSSSPRFPTHYAVQEPGIRLLYSSPMCFRFLCKCALKGGRGGGHEQPYKLSQCCSLDLRYLNQWVGLCGTAMGWLCRLRCPIHHPICALTSE